MFKIISILLVLISLVACVDILNLDKACDTCIGYNFKALCPSNPDIASTTVRTLAFFHVFVNTRFPL